MKKMRCLGVCLCLTLLAAGCTGTGENQYNPPLLSKDASALLELRSNIDFGATLQGERFSTEKVLTGYVFDANQGARVTITLKSTNGETPVLILYGPVNNQGIWGEHIALDFQGQGNLDGLISGLSLPATGRYLVALGTVDGSAGGTFDLSLGCTGVCSEPHCPDVACDLYCPNGFMTDPDGCPVCICAEQECQTDEDCMIYPWTDQIPRCVDGQCIFEEFYCDETMPCPEGFECVFGPCPGAPCTEDYCPPCPGHCEPVTVNECNNDSECPAGFVCLLQCTGVACEPGSSDCPPDCDSATGECPVECFGQCVPEAIECQTNDECPPGHVCEVACWDCDVSNPDGSDCLPGCEGHCVPETLPECDTNADCPEGFECVMECWVAGCDASGACPPECDPATGECDPICVGHCVPRHDECQVDEDCWLAGGDFGRCIDGRCVFDEIPCDDTMSCPPGMECVTVCWDCPDDDPDCTGGCESYCVPVNNECYADTDCISPDGTVGHCVEGRCVFEPQYCHADWECPPGFVCEMMGCNPGCDDATDPDCCVGICVPDQQPECWSDEDCMSPDGTFGRCIDGRCVFDPCACPEIWDPVCAIVCFGDTDPDECPPGETCTGYCEEVTFPNACFAECEGAQIIHMGECGTNPGVCFTDADCQPGEYCEHCIGPDGTMGPCYEEGICLPLPPMECTTDDECPDGFRCEVGYCPDMPCEPDGSCPPCWGQCVPIESGCIVTGCSGEICAPYPMSSTCVWLPEYECLQLTTCELLTSGSGMQTCGWVQTPEYLQCLENINNNNQCDSDDQCPPGMVCEVFCDAAGVCYSQCVGQDCVCPEYYEPVCGYDGVTYDNICFLECAGVEMMFPGPCEDHP